MKQLMSKLAIGAAALAIAGAPLAASAQDWHHDRGHVVYHRAPVRHWHEGYYGPAPGGWVGYYHHGRWYHHRRMHNGIYIYF